MKRVISLEITRKEGKEPNNLYGIIFNNNQIEQFLFVPSDYTVNEFTNVICSEYCCANVTTPTILFDRRSIGIQFEDCFKLNNIYNILNPNSNDMAVMWLQAKEYAINLAMNSHFDSIGKTEFKKMFKELDNFEIKQREGKCILNIIDREKNISRAICYLQYLSVIKNIK